jgi:pectinesterase
MNCHLGNHIRPEGWHHWKEHRQQTARYMEFGNEGEGADITRRVGRSRQLTKKEARKITRQTVLGF